MKMSCNSLLNVGLPLAVLALTAASSLADEAPSAAPPPPRASVHDSVIHVPAFDLPLSGLINAETRAALEWQKNANNEFYKCMTTADRDQCYDRLMTVTTAKQRARYPVVSQSESIAGVSTTIVTPIDGVSITNRTRVLINPGHGELESIPIAALGKIKVVTLGLKASSVEDVVAVYKALLRDYKPENIGIYGCSPGRLAELAKFRQQGLPAPAAIGILSAHYWSGGSSDSENLFAALTGVVYKNPSTLPELAPGAMAGFPDTLVVTSTRDLFMSPLVVLHSRLVREGVRADLHVWEGLGHGFFADPDLPESREVYAVVIRFFGEHLGRANSVAKVQ